MTHCRHNAGTHEVPKYIYDGPLEDLVGCYVRLGRKKGNMMWVKVERIVDDQIFARVDNEPIPIEGMSVGDEVRFGRPEIEEVLQIH